MVKIVNKDPHPSVIKEIICTSCGCTLEYVPIDIQTKIRTDYLGDSESIKFIKCPNCSSEINVK